MLKDTKLPMVEKRRFQRVPAKTLVEYTEIDFDKLSNGSKVALSKNISANGIMLTTNSPIPVGSLIRMTLRPKGWQKFRRKLKGSSGESSPPVLEIIGRVVRIDEIIPQKKYDMGICFVNMDKKEQDKLNRYLKEEGRVELSLPTLPALDEKTSSPKGKKR